jgi:hypothetical protein
VFSKHQPLISLRIAAAILLLVLASPSSIAAGQPRCILLLDSFEKEFAPFDVFKATFRNELAEGFPEPVAFYELPVDPARLATQSERGKWCWRRDVEYTAKAGRQPGNKLTANAARCAFEPNWRVAVPFPTGVTPSLSKTFNGCLNVNFENRTVECGKCRRGGDVSSAIEFRSLCYTL